MKHELKLPYHYGDVVTDRLKVLEINKKYEAFTLNERLEIVKCECSIENDGSWNHHNNYDDSENVLKVGNVSKWWTLNESEIKKIQKEHLDKAIKLLTDELDRLKSNAERVCDHNWVSSVAYKGARVCSKCNTYK